MIRKLSLLIFLFPIFHFSAFCQANILPGHYAYTNSIGTVHIIGEVVNNSNKILTFVKLTANLKNQIGEIVANGFTYTCLDNLPPGVKTCFDLMISGKPPAWSSYEFLSVGYSENGKELPVATVTSSGVLKTYPWQEYDITGEVFNSGVKRIEFVSIVGSLYGQSGNIIDCDFTYADITHLDPMMRSSFNLSFFGPSSYSGVSSYTLQVDGIIKDPLNPFWRKVFLPFVVRQQ